jgi:hypothetical protein
MPAYQRHQANGLRSIVSQYRLVDMSPKDIDRALIRMTEPPPGLGSRKSKYHA